MLLVVTGVGFLIHVYSVGYMAHEEGYARYFSYLNLFLFFMTVLVMAGNVLLMFVRMGRRRTCILPCSSASGSRKIPQRKRRQEGTSSPTASATSQAFLIGIFLLLANFGTLTFSEIATKLNASPTWTGGILTTTALCLLLGATRQVRSAPRFTSGCPTPWKAPLRSPRSFMQPPWSLPAST